jgi:mannonate dehydratase
MSLNNVAVHYSHKQTFDLCLTNKVWIITFPIKTRGHFMKLGLGLFRSMLTQENFRFARQVGATHLVVHLVDYFKDSSSLSTGTGEDVWGVTQNQGKLWTYEELRDLRAAVNAEGLTLEAIENFDPSHWYDILLDGPRKAEQMDNLKTIIRNMGRAGIPIMGYHFSLAGVWGRVEEEFARGGARSVGFVGDRVSSESPIPNGTVWNMVYDPDAPAGTIGPVSAEEMWQRLTYFLTELAPVAQEAGVRLAAHPDDPPLPTLRGTPRLIHQPRLFQKLIDIVPDPVSSLEFCVGTISEMTEGDVYEVIDKYSKEGRIGYVHLRNVMGKVPNYHEVFIDEGATDMFRILKILHKNNFDGVVIPDHTPQVTCPAPWHAGMAHALGWMRGALTAIEQTSEA